MSLVFFFSFMLPMVVTMVLIPPLMRSAERWQFVDVANDRKVHAGAIPRVGGMAMVLGAALPIALWLFPHTQVLAYLLGLAVVFVFGVWDDRSDLDYKLKFAGQVVAVLIVVAFGGIVIDVSSYVGEQWGAIIAVPLTVIFLLGVTNAINLADGLDGLAGGTTLLCVGVISVLAYLEGNLVVVVIGLSVIGSLVGFLRFNNHPAQVFMGDAGSQFLGFSAGVLGLMLTQQAEGQLSKALPLLLLGVPIVDTLLVMGQRILSGRSPFVADKNHIHHKLLDLGIGHYQAVIYIYLVQALLVTAAYFLRYAPDVAIVAVFALFCLAVIGLFSLTSATGWRIHANEQDDGWVRQAAATRLMQGAYLSTVVMLALFVVSAPALISAVPMDIGLLAIMALGILIAAHYFSAIKDLGWLDRAVAYLIVTIMIYLLYSAPVDPVLVDWIYDVCFAVLAIAVLISFRFFEKKGFRITPLDVLVLFLALIIPNLPGVQSANAQFGVWVAKLIVLYYALELIFSNISKGRRVIRVGSYLLLGLLGIRGLV